MLAAIKHRGPDDEGVEFLSPQVTLIHTRLSIIDLTPAGHQPMRDYPPEGVSANWITYNGEIFNYKELQPELEKEGWTSRTASDTEIILHAYRVWGAECVKRFRGMFAFCLMDQTRGLAFLSRDRLGIKPLYLFKQEQGGLAFASELRTLLALGPELISPVVNPSSLESFLAQGAVQGYDTIIDGITLLEPGANLFIDIETGKEIGRKTYWQLPAASEEGLSLSREKREEAIVCLSALARETVRLRLISDVPLGLFLSGGIDSASMLALASEVNADAARTICLGFDVADYDESRDAEATARAFNSNHTTLKITGEDVLNSLPSVFQAMDQPTVDGMNTYVVSGAARRAGLTVALSGLGGDELFGGYASFTDAPRAVSLRKKLRWTSLGKLAASFRRNRSGIKLKEAFEREPDLLTMYLLRRELFLPQERRALLALELSKETDKTTGLQQSLLDDLRRRSESLDDINRISFFEIELYMRNMLLRDGDTFSMAAPIEYRVPFLDHLFVEAVFSVPGKHKKADPRPKPLLLDLVGPTLPQSVWQKPKRGFTFPWGAWFARGGALEKTAQEAVSDAELWKRLNINQLAVAEIWRQFLAGDARISPLQILAFVTLRDFATRHKLKAA
jgi:asparagine synthase (glutamine-hydrolysing)